MREKGRFYFPIFLKIWQKTCVVVGGGSVAARKVLTLLDYGAKVTVVSPGLHPDLVNLADRKRIRVIRRDFKVRDLKDALLVVAATNSKRVNRQVARESRRVGAMVNVVDDPDSSDFIMPSILRRGNLVIGISTGGLSPALAKKIRMKLEASFGEEYASLVSLVEEIRSTLKRKGIRVNGEKWEEALDLDGLTHLIRSGKKRQAKAFLTERLTRGIKEAGSG